LLVFRGSLRAASNVMFLSASSNLDVSIGGLSESTAARASADEMLNMSALMSSMASRTSTRLLVLTPSTLSPTTSTKLHAQSMYLSLGVTATAVPLTYTHSTGRVCVRVVAVVVVDVDVDVDVVVDVVSVDATVLGGNPPPPPPPPPPAEADSDEKLTPNTVTVRGLAVMDVAVASRALCAIEPGVNVRVMSIDPDVRAVLCTSATVMPALTSTISLTLSTTAISPFVLNSV
jgi:hypothetical protein